jgi:hypothetical protein
MRTKVILVFATALLLSLTFGQGPARIVRPPARRPILAARTFADLRVGIDKDGSVWVTTLWFLGSKTSSRSLSATVTLADAEGGFILLMAQPFGSAGTPMLTSQLELPLPARNGLTGIVLTAPNAAFPAQSVSAKVKMSAGCLSFALIQNVRGDSVLASAIVTNPPLMASPPTMEFAMGIPVLGNSVDLSLNFSNPSSGPVTVTFSAYESGVSDSFASVNVELPARTITASLMVSQIFAASEDFKRHLASNPAPALLVFRVVSSQPFAMSANRVDFLRDGSLTPTEGSQVFPLLSLNDR